MSLLKFNNLKKKFNFCKKVSKVKFIIKKTKLNKKQSKNIRISLLKFNNLKKKIIKLVKIYI